MGRHRWAWLALGALVAGLVLLRTLITYNPKAVAVPLACMFWLVCWLTWRDPRAAHTVVWLALILMVVSLLLHEVGLDADVLNYSDQSWSYQLSAVAKHGSELAGWILLASGIIAGMAGRPVPRATAPRKRFLEASLLKLESVARCCAGLRAAKRLASPRSKGVGRVWSLSGSGHQRPNRQLQRLREEPR